MIDEGRNPGKFSRAICERPAAGAPNSPVTKTEGASCRPVGMPPCGFVGARREKGSEGCAGFYEGLGNRCDT
jgi:hypothetical protein